MPWSIALFGLLISLPGFACLGMIFLDYHKKGNIHKAILYIVTFILLLFVFARILVPLFSFYIVLVIPVLLLLYLLISKMIR